MSLIYIASPYSAPDEGTRDQRYLAVMDFVAECLNHRIWVYSPILHCHALAAQHGLPTEYEFWNEYNEEMIRRCSGLFMLMLPSWEQSRGCRSEIAYALKLGKPVTYFDSLGRQVEAPQ